MLAIFLNLRNVISVMYSVQIILNITLIIYVLRDFNIGAKISFVKYFKGQPPPLPPALPSLKKKFFLV